MNVTQTLTRGTPRSGTVQTTAAQVATQEGVLKRFLWLYGVYSLLSLLSYLFGYYFLPEGFFRGTPVTAAGEVANSPDTFWGQFALTLLFNLGWMIGLTVLLNFNQVKGFPVAFLLPMSLGITSGLISGSNSFVASNLDLYSAHEGLALAHSIGGLEMMGYILIIAATVRLGIYQYRSWWRWGGEWKPTKLMNIRDIRFSATEVLAIVAGVALLVFAAYRETLMAFNLL